MITRNVRKVWNTAFLACCLFAGGMNAQQYKWDTPPYAEDYAFITNDGVGFRIPVRFMSMIR